MKIPAILTCLLAVFLASVPVRRAQAEEVSFDVFYNNLADDGDWYNTPEYGYVWQPSIAYKNDKWRPYTDGYWAQTDDGWTWVSYENFGWATYHYGRWTRLKDVGWAWVPGYDWGPGWVSWRTSDDYVGWAPLPPKVERGVYEGRVVDRAPAEAIDYNDVEPEDYGSDVDVQYDIGPQNYCFVDTHNFGAPVLGEVCLPPERNFVIIENTVNVTNIYRRRGPDNFVVFNRGPDYNFISAHSERPIQQLRIDRHDDIGFLRNGIHGGGNANQVHNGVFSVASPGITRGPINFAQVKPAKVKETIARPEVVHGWSHAGGDPAAIQRLHEKFQQQAQAAPAPRRETGPLPPRPPITAVNPPTGGNAAQPFNQPNAGPRQPVTDADKAARRDAAQRARDERQKAPGAGQPPAGGPARGPAAATNTPVPNGQDVTPQERKAARQAQKQQERAPQQSPAGAQPFAKPGQPSAANTTAPAAPAPDADKAARRAQRQQEKAQQAQQTAQAQQAAQAQQTQERQAQQQQAAQAQQQQQARQAQQQQARQAQQQQDDRAQQATADRDARRAQRPQEQPTAPRASQPQVQPEAANPDREARRAQRPQQDQPAAPRAPQPQAEAPRRQPESAPQAAPQGKGDDDKKKRKDQPE